VAGRDQLDDSDQIDMQGFFDDLDGLSTLGGDNEGNAFSIDGLSPELAKVTLDGQGFGEGRGNGGVGAGDLPPEMILRVDVRKTPTAAMEEGGAGGRVNLRLRNPIEIPKPTNSLKVKLGYVPDKDNFNPSASVFAGRPSDNRKFGFMLSANLVNREKQFGTQDITSWILRDFDSTPAYMPRQVRNNAVTNDQRDVFLGLVFGFRPHDSLDIGSKIFLSRKEKATENLGLQHRLDRQEDIEALTFDERIVTSLESFDDRRRNLRAVGSTRVDQIDSMVLGADFNWRRENWRLQGAVGHTVVDSESDTPSQNVTFESNSPFGYIAAADGSLLMSYTDAFPATGEFTANRVNLSLKNTRDTDTFGGIDLVRPMGEGLVRRIKVGGKIREMTRSRGGSKASVGLDGLSLSDSNSGQMAQTPWDAVAWPAVDMGNIDRIVQESEVDWQANLQNEYDIEQWSSAGYVQVDFRASLTDDRFLIGDIGARLVGTETRIDGYQDFGEGLESVSLKSSYTDFLPSVNARARIAERASLTLGVARVMTRPAFNNLAPGIRVNYSDKTGKSGNPDLQPFRANQYLAEVAWAPERGRRLTATISYRDVKNYTALGEEEIEIGDDTYLVTRPVNGGNGSILSVAARMNQNLRQMSTQLRYFSVSLSYTSNQSRTDFLDPGSGDTLPIPNTAEQVVKASLNYNKESFAGKLKYNWRGSSLKSSFSESGLAVWNQPAGSLDLNLAWQLKENVRLGFDARNLLNEEKLQTTDFSGQLLRISEQDRAVSVTLRAKW
jgi:TonB-dependent receptor